jgi:hypothetical protein
MNFSALKEFRKNPASGLSQVVDFLANEMAATIRELRVGLQNLTFADNFDSFEKTITIPVSTEFEITNELTTIPKGFLVLKKNEGGIYVCEGDTSWTLERIYLKNTSATAEAVITVRFFK